ncbi:hypothetical protein ACQ4LE_004941 [Meloidogyne hapla]|uniref:S-formylglutathione hydrolase n=1 Tax=Meloidogyne hapla TaxID=6305 RepID=A0A1I8BRG9_MELHA
MSGKLKQISSNFCFEGYQNIMEHFSDILNCRMKFGIYLPDCCFANPPVKVPILFWLSGLTCTEENFIIKSGMQRFASKYGIIVVNPDTSPRGDDIPKGIDGDPDFGVAAGFYLDATEPKFAKNYKMYSYFVKEFVPLIFDEYKNHLMIKCCGLFGHSMGGHGALTIGLKNPELFKSISVFAPICNPMKKSPNFGYKHLEAFLGPQNDENISQWEQYDSVAVAKKYKGPKCEILIDQGSKDPYLQDLLPNNLISVSNPNIVWKYNLRENYDHGFYFISTFIEEHFIFHVKFWGNMKEMDKK